MSDEDFGAFLVRRDLDNRVPFKAGDNITTYVFGEQYPYLDLPAHGGHTQEHVDYMNQVIATATETDWGVRDELKCDCHERRTIAQVLVHLPDSKLWVVVKPERVPVAHRSERNTRTEAWALHGNEGEAPHFGDVASCKGCRARWLVVSFPDRAEMFRIKSATHGAKVVP